MKTRLFASKQELLISFHQTEKTGLGLCLNHLMGCVVLEAFRCVLWSVRRCNRHNWTLTGSDQGVGGRVDGGCFPNYRMMVSKAEQEVKGGQDGSATALSNVLQLQTLKRT